MHYEAPHLFCAEKASVCRISHAGWDFGVRLGCGERDADATWRGGQSSQCGVACAFTRVRLFGVGAGYVPRQADGRSGELSSGRRRVAGAFGAQLSEYRDLSRSCGRDGAHAGCRRLHRRERGQFPHRGRQAERGGLDRALHGARAEHGPAADGARALCVVLAGQSIRLYQRSGRRLHPYLQARCCDGANDAGGDVSRSAGVGREDAAIFIPMGTRRIA